MFLLKTLYFPANLCYKLCTKGEKMRPFTKKLLLVAVLMVLLVLVLAMPNRVASSPYPTVTPITPTPTSEILFSPTSTLSSPTPFPTDLPTVVPTVTALPTSVNCPVPVSIMLHWNDSGILPSLLDDIQSSGYIVVTYQQALLYCQQGYDTSNMVVLTFDDAGPSGIYDSLLWMLDYTNQRGFVGVVGVIAGNLPSGDWDYLRMLNSRGWEIANHSTTHPAEGIPFLSDGALRYDIEYVQQRVLEEIGVAPTSLILPGGTYNNDRRIDAVSKEFGIKFIVGIGTGMDPWFQGEGPYYVGRVAPWNDANFTTWTYALRVFGPQD
jgi:peptidoglycan/xylan/chitin deacetylase (PgdA/CDA1 family)